MMGNALQTELVILEYGGNEVKQKKDKKVGQNFSRRRMEGDEIRTVCFADCKHQSPPKTGDAYLQ